MQKQEQFFIMSDNGVSAEDERSPIKDEGGDDEVRDGVFTYTSPRPVHHSAGKNGGSARL